MIEDAGVDVDAAVVVGRLDVVAHVRRLWIAPQDRVVVRGPGKGQRADSLSVEVGTEDFCADEPVRLVRGLAQRVLPDHDAERVGDVLIERTGLTGIAEGGGVLRHAVRQLVADHIHRSGEAVEDAAVAVAVHHLTAVPHGVVEAGAIVNGGVETEAVAVDGAETEDALEEVVRRAAAVEGFVDFDVRTAGVALGHDEGARQLVLLLRVVDTPVLLRPPARTPGGGRRFHERADTPRGELPHVLESGAGAVARFMVRLVGDVPQDVRRDDAADHVG